LRPLTYYNSTFLEYKLERNGVLVALVTEDNSHLFEIGIEQN